MSVAEMTENVDTRVIHLVQGYSYAQVFVLNPHEIVKDGATVEAFKRYLDSQLKNEGVDRFERELTVAYAMGPVDDQVAVNQLVAPASRLDYQPWFDRYFTKVVSYEPGVPDGEDIREMHQKHWAQGWKHLVDHDTFFPKY